MSVIGKIVKLKWKRRNFETIYTAIGEIMEGGKDYVSISSPDPILDNFTVWRDTVISVTFLEPIKKDVAEDYNRQKLDRLHSYFSPRWNTRSFLHLCPCPRCNGHVGRLSGVEGYSSGLSPRRPSDSCPHKCADCCCETKEDVCLHRYVTLSGDGSYCDISFWRSPRGKLDR